MITLVFPFFFFFSFKPLNDINSEFNTISAFEEKSFLKPEEEQPFNALLFNMGNSLLPEIVILWLFQTENFQLLPCQYMQDLSQYFSLKYNYLAILVDKTIADQHIKSSVRSE